jgi:hypothetical protein
MQTNTGKNITIWEWIAIFGLASIAIGITEVVDVSQKWEDVIVFTVVLFSAVMLTLRDLWKNPDFWRDLIPLFTVHITVFSILARLVPLGRFGFPKLVLIAGGMIEGFLIIAILWKRAGRRS